MQRLTLDDLLPLDEYIVRREEFFAAHRRYCDLYRRIRVGPSVALIFENRQTLWFRVQELIRVTRLRDPNWVQRELNLVNSLLPRPHHLQAALIYREEALELDSNSVQLKLGALSVPARITSCRPEDRALGMAHWLEFPMLPADRTLLADVRVPGWFEVACNDEHHASDAITDEMRQSLLDDLEMSDRAN